MRLTHALEEISGGETGGKNNMNQVSKKVLSVLLSAALTVGTIGFTGAPASAAAGSSYGDT